MSEVLVPAKVSHKKSFLGRTNELEDFARGIENKLRKAGSRDALANLVCRLLHSKDERIAALMLCKWVEWRYGKAHEHIDHSGPNGGPVQFQIISHIPRPGDPVPTTSLAERELAEPGGAEALPADVAEPDGVT